MILLVLLLLLWRLLVVATFQYNFQSEHLYHNRCHNHYHYPPSSGWRRPRKSRNVFYRSLSSDEGTIPAVMNNSKAGYPILIRDCLNDDLSRVCDLIMESFYYNTCSSRSNHQTIWNNEFQKLQSTFQDMTTSERHSDRNQKQNYMLVAIATDDDDDYDVKNIGTVVGFVHVDNRPPLPNACLDHCPRPILTDLMVCKSMQRKGIARRLMRVCEDIIAKQSYQCSSSLYLRVVDTNHAAISFYQSIGYNYRPDMSEESRPELKMFQKVIQ